MNLSKKTYLPPWREKIFKIIFKVDTKPGKTFDILLLILIILSVIAVILDSVEVIRIKYGKTIFFAEWFFTILFTIEYVLRIISVKKIPKYIFSFYGIIDLLAVLPSYISLLFVGTQYLLVIRILRLLRVFRILKLDRYVGASGYLKSSLKASRHKIIVFFGFLFTIVVIMGSLMYLIEGPENGFTNIPKSIYWAIVTLTTVGYGDITPNTVLGQTLSSIIMILGYTIIAIPTGIISVEISRARDKSKKSKICKICNNNDIDMDAKYCKICGEKV